MTKNLDKKYKICYTIMVPFLGASWVAEGKNQPNQMVPFLGASWVAEGKNQPNQRKDKNENKTSSVFSNCGFNYLHPRWFLSGSCSHPRGNNRAKQSMAVDMSGTLHPAGFASGVGKDGDRRQLAPIFQILFLRSQPNQNPQGYL